jgi:hypothetical protein
MTKIQKKRLSLKIKREIVHKLEQAIVNIHGIGREYGISATSVRKIRKNKDLIKQHCDEHNANLGVTRLILNPEGVAFNNSLIDHVKENRKDGQDIHEEDYFLEGEAMLNRQPSKGKIHRFKKRFNLISKTMCGTSGDLLRRT